jgi:phosphatidylserine synthase
MKWNCGNFSQVLCLDRSTSELDVHKAGGNSQDLIIELFRGMAVVWGCYLIYSPSESEKKNLCPTPLVNCFFLFCNFLVVYLCLQCIKFRIFLNLDYYFNVLWVKWLFVCLITIFLLFSHVDFACFIDSFCKQPSVAHRKKGSFL